MLYPKVEWTALKPQAWSQTPVGAGGIQVDVRTKRLYWATFDSRIMSSNLDGTDVVTIHQVSANLYGLALLDERLYWGYSVPNSIQSSSVQADADIRVEYSETAPTIHFTAPAGNKVGNRRNHCERIACEGVCVLTATSSSCVSK